MTSCAPVGPSTDAESGGIQHPLEQRHSTLGSCHGNVGRSNDLSGALAIENRHFRNENPGSRQLVESIESSEIT